MPKDVIHNIWKFLPRKTKGLFMIALGSYYTKQYELSPLQRDKTEIKIMRHLRTKPIPFYEYDSCGRMVVVVGKYYIRRCTDAYKVGATDTIDVITKFPKFNWIVVSIRHYAVSIELGGSTYDMRGDRYLWWHRKPENMGKIAKLPLPLDTEELRDYPGTERFISK